MPTKSAITCRRSASKQPTNSRSRNCASYIDEPRLAIGAALLSLKPAIRCQWSRAWIRLRPVVKPRQADGPALRIAANSATTPRKECRSSIISPQSSATSALETKGESRLWRSSRQGDRFMRMVKGFVGSEDGVITVGSAASAMRFLSVSFRALNAFQRGAMRQAQPRCTQMAQRLTARIPRRPNHRRGSGSE